VFGNNKSIFITLTVLLAQCLLIAILVPYSVLSKANEIEYKWMGSIYSDRSMDWMMRKTDSWHYSMTRETGLADMLQWAFFPDDKPGHKKTGMDRLGDRLWFPYLEDRGKALDEMVKIMIMRMLSIWIWVPLILLIAIPTVIDGMMERKIKQHTFKYPSPFLYRYGARFSIFSIAMFLFAFFAPIPMPPVVIPLIIMFSIVVMGLIVVANAPKRL
jgi:hypothetical protein